MYIFCTPCPPSPPPPPTTTIRFLMVRLWTFLQMAFSTMLCSSQRSKKPLGKTPTHKVARKYLTKSVVLILMLNMQICSCPQILKIWFLYVVWWAHEMSIKYKSSPGFTWVFSLILISMWHLNYHLSQLWQQKRFGKNRAVNLFHRAVFTAR